MTCSLFLLFNRHLTRIQTGDAHTSLGVCNIIELPYDFEELWQQIPPDLPEIDNYPTPIKKYQLPASIS